MTATTILADAFSLDKESTKSVLSLLTTKTTTSDIIQQPPLLVNTTPLIEAIKVELDNLTRQKEEQ